VEVLLELQLFVAIPPEEHQRNGCKDKISRSLRRFAWKFQGRTASANLAGVRFRCRRIRRGTAQLDCCLRAHAGRRPQRRFLDWRSTDRAAYSKV